MSWPSTPERPNVPSTQVASGLSRPRYEDIAQDGRLRLEGIWPPIGPILWSGELPITRSLAQLGALGIRAVLTRVELWGGSEPISVRNPISHELAYALSHSRDGAGQVDRILFDTWLSSSAPRGVPNDPGQPASGRAVLVARAYGQHVFTRPGAAPGQHRVLELCDPDLPRVPEVLGRWLDPLALLELPDGAEPLEPALQPDPAPIAFGLAHTDGNQHVNFLAYPRLVEDAALRRLSALGHGSRWLARHSEIGYRKPCFAGDRMRIVLQAFRHGTDLGVIAGFVPEGSGLLGKPHSTARMLLSR
jgi:hypothetical protein